jgi:predicted aspartyl protease
MLQGIVDVLGRPRVTVAVRGSYGTAHFEAIVDTAFTGTFSLPLSEIQRLGLLRHSSRMSVFADGRAGVIYTYWSEIEWVGSWMNTEVWESGVSEAIVGAGLLRGYELIVNYGPAQSVEIR